jgi:hypothetical protein
MAENRSPTPPPTGFMIMSDGSVLRGKDTSTYSESQIQEWLASWRVMKSMGCFDNPASSTTSTSSQAELKAPEVTDHQLPKLKEKKKSKKGKKGKKH